MDLIYEYAFDKLIDDDDQLNTDKKIEMIEEFIRFGFDINKNDSSLLIEAIRNGDQKIVNYLIEKGININNKSLIMACNYNDLELIKILLQLGTFTIDDNILCIPHRNTNLNVVKLLVEFGYNPLETNRLLYCAYHTGNLPLLEYLISIGADCTIDNNKLLCLTLSYYGNRLEIQKLLLKNGADPNTIDEDGFCLLELAVINRKLDCCKILFEYGADINLCHNIINKNSEKSDRQISDLIFKTQEIVDLFMDKGLDIYLFIIAEQKNNK